MGTRALTAAEIGALRKRLQGGAGRDLWKSLDEAADTPAFRRWLESELPAASAIFDAGASRREVLRTMAASVLLAGLPACEVYPPEDAVAWVEAPEYDVPGKPRYYATMVPFMGYARPVVAECHAGRPTRLDGNDRFPAGGTALDPFVQAEVLRLYDPDRSAGALQRGRRAETRTALASVLRAFGQRRSGRGVYLLTGQITSPTLLRQIDALKARLPGLRWHAYESAGPDREAEALAFGEPRDVHLHLDVCDVAVSLEADLLGPGPGQLRHAADWAARRRRGRLSGDVNRLYVAESSPSLTGAKASRRLPAPSAAMP
ncbi:MAG TPA: TAT-variant-translocated molybdopterin oxidoreductase, partial [Woeseiaceae bacterium]|nr:TAT-variant-translocated molybdopterin oxidoreductase [Woeseiaceae bacterium]